MTTRLDGQGQYSPTRIRWIAVALFLQGGSSHSSFAGGPNLPATGVDIRLLASRLFLLTMKRAFEEKTPKLYACKLLGARTVLILEAVDPPFHAHWYIAQHLPALLRDCLHAPDEIYLVDPQPNLGGVYGP